MVIAIKNKKTKEKDCKEILSENKVVSHHTKNLLKDLELEEGELINEVCENLDD